jgi:Skp family chaperone for outer membrane proteins
MSNLTSVVTQLEQERSRIKSELQSIQSAIAALHGKQSSGAGGGMSAAGRARIAAAQRARWARVKAQKSGSSASRLKSKRRMSPAAIARIRAAQRARWAKWRKEHKG